MDEKLQKCCKCGWTGYDTDMTEKPTDKFENIGVPACDLVCPVCENNEFYLVRQLQEKTMKITRIGETRNMQKEAHRIEFETNGLEYVITPEPDGESFRLHRKDGCYLSISPCVAN